MIFVLLWKEAATLCIDAPDEAQARARGLDIAGEPPAAVMPLADGTFVAEVRWVEAGDPGELEEELTLVPLAHTAEILEMLDDSDPDKLNAASASSASTLPPCLDEADGDAGEVFRCEREHGHLDVHRARDAAGRVVEW